MNIVDIIILIFVLFGALLGFKRGFLRQLVTSVGSVLVVVLAFALKNRVAMFLYENLPFFKFGGIFKGVTVLNILIYEIIAFLVLVLILTFILRLIIIATKIFERILNMTIVLGIISKILGALLGIIEHIVLAFAFIFVLSLPIINISVLNESKFKDIILNETPVLSNFTKNNIEFVDDVMELKEKYATETDANAFNLEALDLLLKHKITNKDSINRLIEKNKISITGIDTVLEKY